MTLSANATATGILSNLTASAANLTANIANAARIPVELLRKYFSACLGHEVSIRQTWLIVQAQAAFILAAFATECPLVTRAMFAVWFLVSAVRCGNNRA